MTKLMCNPGGIFIVTMMLLSVAASHIDLNAATKILTEIADNHKQMQDRLAASSKKYLSAITEQQKRLLTNQITLAEYGPRIAAHQAQLAADNAAAVTDHVDTVASKGAEVKFKQLLEKLRTSMPNGIPGLGLPPMEPLKLDEINFEVDNPEIGELSVAINNLTLSGLPTFVVNKAKVSLIGQAITASVTIPRIRVDGQYNVSGTVSLWIPVTEAGPFSADIYDFQLYVNTKFAYSLGMLHPYLKTFDLDFSLKTIDVDLKSFMNDKEFGRRISKVIKEKLPKALDKIKSEKLPTIRSYIGGRINETMQQLTTNDIIGVLLAP